MAHYNHVSSKNDLLRAIAAHVLDNANLDGSASDWRTQAWRGCDTPEQAELPQARDFDSAFEFGLGQILDGVETVIQRVNCKS